MEQCWLNFVFMRGEGGSAWDVYGDNTEQLAGPKWDSILADIRARQYLKGNEYSDVNTDLTHLAERQDKAEINDSGELGRLVMSTKPLDRCLCEPHLPDLSFLQIKYDN